MYDSNPLHLEILCNSAIMPVLAACILSFSVAASATAPAFVSADVWIPPSSRLLAVTLSAALGISLLFVVFAAFLALRLGGPMAGLNQSRPPHDGSRVKGFVAPGFEEVLWMDAFFTTYLSTLYVYILTFGLPNCFCRLAMCWSHLWILEWKTTCRCVENTFAFM